MNLVIDIGNTTTKVAIFDRSEIREEIIYEELPDKDVLQLLEKYPQIKKGIVSTTGENLQLNTAMLLEERLEQMIFFDENTPIPIKNSYGSKTTLGKDRLAAAIAAQALFPNSNALVIDCGTAITYEFINAEGEYLGGNISLGLSMRFKALHHFTKRLPLVAQDNDYGLIGEDTISAIRNGVINGIIFEIEGYIQRTEGLFADLKLILTGGDAIFFDKKLKKTIFVVSNLVLIGLNRILEYNDQ